MVDFTPLAVLCVAAFGGFLGLLLGLILWAFIPAGGWLLIPPAAGGVLGLIAGSYMCK